MPVHAFGRACAARTARQSARMPAASISGPRFARSERSEAGELPADRRHGVDEDQHLVAERPGHRGRRALVRDADDWHLAPGGAARFRSSGGGAG